MEGFSPSKGKQRSPLSADISWLWLNMKSNREWGQRQKTSSVVEGTCKGVEGIPVIWPRQPTLTWFLIQGEPV